MRGPKANEPGLPELKESIRRRILERTGDRIRDLEVEVTEARIEIRGRTASFYIKQLAIQGTLDVIGVPTTTPIEVNVQVEREPSSEPR
ncbi:MAG TPA: hypothetical protein VKS79_00120 [Gemmataceae bacterium]|nr:hypothetical protein [Gemmataceae bacterium]